ncbi:MAG: LysM peptidoglycan-binding domain-containing protein [Gammaproteobacteria bacterium]
MLAAARVDGKRGAVARGRQHVHVVRRGDTLWAVARDTGMDVRTLATMNGMQPGDTLRAGQKLKLTAAAPSGSSRAVLASTSSSAASGERPVTHVVRSGDTLFAIAKLYQVTVRRSRPGTTSPPAPRSSRAKGSRSAYPLAAADSPLRRFLNGFSRGKTRPHRGRGHGALDRLGHRAGDAS